MSVKKLTPADLLELIDPKNPDLLKTLGGAHGVAQSLDSNIEKGLAIHQIEKQKIIHGTNLLPEAVSKSFLAFVLEAMGDKTLIVLMFAAGLEIAIGIYKGWFAPEKDQLALVDGAAIVVAILIVVALVFIFNYRVPFRITENKRSSELCQNSGNH
jgi:Ca2+-transporting ATPase